MNIFEFQSHSPALKLLRCWHTKGPVSWLPAEHPHASDALGAAAGLQRCAWLRSRCGPRRLLSPQRSHADPRWPVLLGRTTRDAHVHKHANPQKHTSKKGQAMTRAHTHTHTHTPPARPLASPPARPPARTHTHTQELASMHIHTMPKRKPRTRHAGMEPLKHTHTTNTY